MNDDLLDLAPDSAGERRFLTMSKLPSGGMRWRVNGTVYEHPRATYGIKGPGGHSLAIDLDAMEPPPEGMEAKATLILSPKAGAALKKLRPLDGKVLLLSPLGDVMLDDGEAPVKGA